MAIPNPLPPRLAFGPYELNASTGELLKDGIRLRLPGQAFSILLLLLKHPGEVVTREQLREQIWREGTFVDFEHGLNAAMNKLRRALSDSAESPRYIETLPGRGYRFIGTLNSCPPGPVPILPKPDAAECRLPPPPQLTPPPQPQRVAVWERLIWAAGALLCLFIGQQFHQVPAAPPPWTLTRVTADIGLSNFPALSPDGNLMAYSSDQGPNGEQDLFVRQVATGPAIRLTFDGAGNTAPDFSPDGARIVFQSSRNGGGIYEISALGGKARLLARSGLNPRYSPDGSQVAYWVGAAGVNAAVPESGALWVVPVNGGAPRRVAPSFPAARQPIWLPDGKRLLFTGYTSSRAYETSALDWWTVATDGSSVVRAGVYEALAQADLVPKVSIERPVLRLPTFPVPGCWSPTANTVVFSFRAKDQTDLWEIEVSPQTGKVTGPPKRLTTETLRAAHPSCTAGGAVAFTSVDTKTDVWSVAFDLDHGKPKGTLERVTMGPSSREHASLATNGHFVAFASNQSGRPNIWVRDLVTGDESPVASSSLEQHYPVMNAAGDKIAFSAFEKDSRTIYVSALGGPPERLCEGCLRATSWSRDGKTILIFGGDPYRIDAINLDSHQRTPLLKHPAYNLLYARFSPDNRWVSFTIRTQPNQARIAIAPLDGLKPIAESAWITISEATPGDWADWAPDGKTLYFSSTRDGHSCLWGQRIDPRSHHPVGDAFPALHLHGRLYYQPGSMWGGWSVGGGRIAMLLAEDTGNIWMMSRQRSRQ